MTDHQGDFGAALLNADLSPPVPVSDGHGGPAAKRFNVYRNNVAVSLADALETAFPVIRTLVGDEFFRALAGVALRQHPPQSPLMAEFGQDMPGFLESFPPVAQLPYLADVARVENALRRAYHAADVVALDGDTLGAMDPADFAATCFTLAPAVTLIRSPYPVGTIWHTSQPGAGKASPQGAEDVMVSRPGFDPVVDVLPKGALDVVSALDGTTPLEHALGAAPDDFDFPTTLGLLLTRGVLTAPKG